MKKAAPHQFTHSHVLSDDGRMTFECSNDLEHWPWLALDPFDPIVVQTINFWAASEAGIARGAFDPTKWTALTETWWTCGEKGVGHAVRGVAEPAREDGTPGYGLRLFDGDDHLVYTMNGTGVTFQTRDFEAWRDKAKQKTAVPTASEDFQYVPAEAVGVAKQSESFLSPLIDRDVPSAHALITKENGFPPGHLYLSGSGDHVNSTHLADVARQFANLLRGGGPVAVLGGEMQFSRYVELNQPFQIDLVQEANPQHAISMTVHQAGRPCATIALDF